MTLKKKPSVIIECDRCELQDEYEDFTPAQSRRPPDWLLVSYDTFDKRFDIDLCPSCGAKFRRFIEGKIDG